MRSRSLSRVLPRAAARALPRVVLIVALLGAGGCASIGYYAQAITGHLDIMARREPIDELLAAPDTEPELRRRLGLVLRARRFASEALALPDNGSYLSYVDLGRRYVTWNVIAAEEFSVAARNWCFPVAGCVPYRGYHAEAPAQALAAELAQQGLDVFVNGATAYSTLGWFDDPVLSTMLRWRDTRLVGVIFHELAHQLLWVEDDTTFNESFATFVEREGTGRWLRAHGAPEDIEAYAQSVQRKLQFTALLREVREQLAEVYAGTRSASDKRAAKQAAFMDLRARYAALRRAWGGYDGYDYWFEQPLNNARLALVGTYNDQVDAFAALFAAADADFPRFYAAVREIAALAPEARSRRLHGLSTVGHAGASRARPPVPDA